MSEPAPTDADLSETSRETADGRETPVTVDAVTLDRAPGFETAGFTLEEFSSGVNVVYGANAAGKSTLAEAIRWSLWPDEAPASATVRTDLTYDGESRRIELHGGVSEDFRDGAPADAIPVPSLDGGRRYALSLHDMLQEETDDGEFASVIQRESTGGFNIDAVRDKFGLVNGASPATRGISETKDAAAAVENVEKLRREAPDLAAERAELSKLKEELADADAARERVDLLETAVEYRKAQDAYDQKQKEVASFPNELAAFNGAELDEVDKLEEQVDTQMGEEREVATKYREAAEKLAATELPEDGVTDEVLQALRGYRDELDDAEDERDRLERDVAEAKAERDEVREKISLDLDDEALREISTDDLVELRSFVSKVAEVEGKQQVEAAVDEWLGDESKERRDRETLESGRNALENWLAAPAEQDSDNQRNRRPVAAAVVAGVLTALSGVVIALTVNPAGIVLTVLGLALAGYAAITARGEEGSTDTARTTHAETFRQTGLEEPDSWEADAVRDRVAALRVRLSAVELDKQEANKRDEIRAQFDIEDVKDELETARQRLQDRFDTEVDDDIELAVTVERVERWQAADETVTGKQAALREAKTQVETSHEQFCETIEPFTTETYPYVVETSTDATAAIGSLEQRQRDYEAATQRLAEVDGGVAQARTDLEQYRSERESLFTERGLEPGDRDRLEVLSEQYAEYKAAVEAKDEAETTLRNRREDLRAFDDYDEAIEERDLDDLENELGEKRKVAGRYDELLEEKTALEKEIEDAKASMDIEAAVQEQDEALRALEEALEADVADAVTDTLLEFLEEETISSNQEPVFQRADDLLRRITDGQFELRLDDGTFRAYDTGEQRRVDLNDLSSGTRVQVLLAVRVAFVEHREQETAPPLLLDETLAPFDDRRAETVLDSVIDLARAGRQVFYFTARHDERARWETRLDESDVEYSLQQLTPSDGHDPVAEPPAIETAGAIDIPAPDGADHRSYRERLEVPTFDPRQGAASAPLWYVTEDPEVLYRLRTAGIERWGNLRALLEVGAVDGLLSEPSREQVRRHGAALEAFVEAYTVGRGKAVDRDVLEATDAVTTKFIDEVSEIADRVDGDPEEILDRLPDVSHFRQNKIEDLRDYLRQEEYLDPQPTRPDEQIRSAVVDTYCQHGLEPTTAATAADRLLDRISTNPDPSENAD
ncbi:AAA family ATPase [Halosolutus gelatinilyticus]|uniref:AAA family ATPase n=1 Tax=Halosolutus gelatinilyticus TaxID=2931975 RepID=UPI001FF51F60|nr:AAA family ATPase [Halosolutus gelatinilyticus]